MPANALLDTPNVAAATVVQTQLVSEGDSNVKFNSSNDLPDDVQKMIYDYEGLTKKLMHLVNLPSTQAATQTTYTQSSAHTDTPSDEGRPNTHDQEVSLRDLPCLHRCEFKVHGGQIGDHSSDISYNGVCRQVEEGVKDNFTNSEVVRGVLRIIKPGHFKDMLINKEDMTVAELKEFLQSHLGGKNSTELFQELM